jgi:hypothetical protein
MVVSKLTDTRRSQRVSADFRMMLIIHKEDQEIGHTVWTVNMSQSGTRIKLKGTLVPGQTVWLLPAEDGRHEYPCRVVWVFTPTGLDRWSEAGLEFQTPWIASKRNAITN